MKKINLNKLFKYSATAGPLATSLFFLIYAIIDVFFKKNFEISFFSILYIFVKAIGTSFFFLLIISIAMEIINTFKRNILKKNLYAIKTITNHYAKIIVFFFIFIFLITHDWLPMFESILILSLLFLPLFLNKKRRILIPMEFQFILLMFLFASSFLGESQDYYIKYFWWDNMLHFLSALTLGFIGFLIIFIIYSNNKIKINYSLLFLFSFTFSLSMGAIWEIFEFLSDIIFNTNMQKSGLFDTMEDLMMDFTGALIASFIGYLYVKYKKGFLIRNFINKFAEKNPKIFNKFH